MGWKSESWTLAKIKARFYYPFQFLIIFHTSMVKDIKLLAEVPKSLTNFDPTKFRPSGVYYLYESACLHMVYVDAVSCLHIVYVDATACLHMV